METVEGRASEPKAAAELPLERVEAELTELVSHINAGTCRFLELLGEFDRREGWAGWGTTSCAHWLNWRLGISYRTARDQVRVARRLPELPAIGAAFSRGELSYSKVRALTRVATADNEATLADIARRSTASEIEALVGSYRGVLTDIEVELAEEDSPRRRHRYVQHYFDDDGFYVIRARLAPEDGAVVEAALTAARRALGSEPRDGGAMSDSSDGSAEPSVVTDCLPEPGTYAASNADALVAMAETVLSTGATPVNGPDRHCLVVHVDVDTLTGKDPEVLPTLDCGPGLDPEVARRLGCDASVITLLERDGEPLNAGRRTRTIPTALRRALVSRDRTCRFPGCTERCFVDAHHLEFWGTGGEHSLFNLTLLCRRHHRAVHEGRFSVSRSADGTLVFKRPDGEVIPAAPETIAAHAADLIGTNLALGLDVASDAAESLWDGNAMDYDLAVHALLRDDDLLEYPPKRALGGYKAR